MKTATLSIINMVCCACMLWIKCALKKCEPEVSYLWIPGKDPSAVFREWDVAHYRQPQHGISFIPAKFQLVFHFYKPLTEIHGEIGKSWSRVLARFITQRTQVLPPRQISHWSEQLTGNFTSIRHGPGCLRICNCHQGFNLVINPTRSSLSFWTLKYRIPALK